MTSKVTVKSSSVPVVFSHFLLYMLFTCWLPREPGDMATFLIGEVKRDMTGNRKLVH